MIKDEVSEQTIFDCDEYITKIATLIKNKEKWAKVTKQDFTRKRAYLNIQI